MYRLTGHFVAFGGFQWTSIFDEVDGELRWSHQRVWNWRVVGELLLHNSESFGSDRTFPWSYRRAVLAR